MESRATDIPLASASSLLPILNAAPAARMQKPILRLEHPDQFTQLPEALRVQVMRELGVERWDAALFDIKTIADDEKYISHYLARIDGIHAGVEFLLANEESLSVQYCDKVKSYLVKLNTDYKQFLNNMPAKNQTEIASYQNTLIDYVNDVVVTLAEQLVIDQKVVKHRLCRAEEFALAKKPRPNVCTISMVFDADNNAVAQIALIDKPLNPFDAKLKEEFRQIRDASNDDAGNLPEWFTDLKDFEKKYLKHFLRGINLDTDLGSVVNSLSSKLRIIPAPANYGSHILCTCIDGKVVVQVPKKRFSHVASRDVIDKESLLTDKQHIRNCHAIRNLRKIISDCVEEKVQSLISNEQYKNGRKITIPILYQTLVSPLVSPDSDLDDDRLFAIHIINSELNTARQSYKEKHGIDISFVIVPTNHPLNFARFLDPTRKNGDTGEAVAALSKCEVLDALDGDQLKIFDQVKKMLLECTSLRLSDFGQHRELYLASLEQAMISLLGGISIGGCVSGKDRKAIELAHTDALKIFYLKYCRLPPLVGNYPNEKEDMRNFAAIFASVYCNKHQLCIAAFNAPGSFGTKTPKRYIPDDLIAAIERWYDLRENAPGYNRLSQKDVLRESNRLASNNDIHGIRYVDYSDKFVPEGAVHYPGRLVQTRTDIPLENVYMMRLFDDVRAAINQYIKDRPKTLSFVHGMNWSARQRKAQCLGKLFENDEFNCLMKAVILLAVMSIESNSLVLQRYLSMAMGFGGVKFDACQAIQRYIKAVIEAQLSTPEEARAAVEYLQTRAVSAIQGVLHNISDNNDEEIRRAVLSVFEPLSSALRGEINPVTQLASFGMSCNINSRDQP